MTESAHDPNQAPQDYELVHLSNGVTSLRNLKNRETYHPAIGPVAEARLLHTEQQRIVERARSASAFSIWDVGLGAAANAITVIRALETDLTVEHQGTVIVHSFDRTLNALNFALANAAELEYIVGFEDRIRQLMRHGRTSINNQIEWRLHLGNFCETIGALQMSAPDAIFYDPYSIKSNIEMWSLAQFSALFARLDPNRPCLITNYSMSTYVRVTMLLAGFQVGVGCAVDKKLETTIFSNRLDMLERPLDRHWLQNRVRNSHSAAAIRGLPYQVAPISEADYATLLKLPQFS